MGWVPESGRIDAPLSTLARLGATTDNDVVIRVDGVSRMHARIVGQPDGYWVEDANSRNGTWVNGERVQRARLRHLDVITLGRFAELVFVERETGETVLPVMPVDFRVQIEWTEGPARGTVIEIPRGETLIGRAESCGIVIDSPAISRAHARLSNTGDRVMIEDLGSANGTSVDGQLLKSPVTLQPGSEVALGQGRRFRVFIEGMSTAAMSAAQDAATPAANQDMDWATRLVFSASDREALARAAGGIDRPSPPPARGVGKDPTPPVVPVPPSPAQPRVATPPPARPVQPARPAAPVAPAPRPAPPAPAPAAPAPAAPAAPANRTAPVAPVAPRAPVAPVAPSAPSAPVTQLGMPAVTPPPKFGTSTDEAPRTQMGGPAFKPPKFEDAPAPPPASDGNTLPGATVLGHRDVGPPPRLGTAGGATPVAPGGAPWRPASVGPAPIQAAVLSGDLGVFTLPVGTSTVGRSPEATIRIDSREVSRIHAVLTVTDRDVIVEDRGSVNGTSINGTAITGTRPLVEGDRVSFADFEFRVEVKRSEGN